MAPQYREFPESWSNDELTTYADCFLGNVVSTSVSGSEDYETLKHLDSIFMEIAGALANPTAIIPAILLMRAHASFRAGSLLAMAGMNPETFVQLRNCLETAMYALHMDRIEGAEEVWISRHDDDDALRRCKREFQFSNVMRTLERSDQEHADVARTLYERTIDFGAHPNERAMTANLVINEQDDGQHLLQSYLAPGTLPHRHSMNSAAFWQMRTSG